MALAAFGALHWMAMLEPSAPGRAWDALGAALLAMVGPARAPRACRRRRAGRRSRSSALLALLLAFLAGGISAELLRPANWDVLAAGIQRGIGDLPGARVPYRGIDQWIRLVIPLGGTMLVVARGARPRSGRGAARTGFPIAALVMLVDALRGAGRRARLRGRVPARRAAGAARARASCGSSGCGSPRPARPPLLAVGVAVAGADRRARARRRLAVVGLRVVGARHRRLAARPRSPGTTTTARSTGRATAARCCA